MTTIAEAPGETTRKTDAFVDDETPRAPEFQVGLDDLDERLAELAGLEEGWDGYGARPIDRRALVVAAAVLKNTARTGMGAPEIFPVPTGGVQLEWVIGTMELEFEIEPGGASAVFVGDDSSTGRRFDGELPRDTALFNQAVATLGSRQREQYAG
jgi:hypothetical protein